MNDFPEFLPKAPNRFNIDYEDIVINLHKKNINKNKSTEETIPRIINFNNYYSQEIIKDNVFLRAYANSYYWLYNKLYDINYRNLGYDSDIQFKISYILKSNIYDFIIFIYNINSKNNEYINIINLIKQKYNSIDDFVKKLTNNKTDGVVEYIILSYLIPIPIVIFDYYSQVKYIYFQGFQNIKDTIKYKKFHEYINIKITDDKIFSIYY
jgi:hypothetical protein